MLIPETSIVESTAALSTSAEVKVATSAEVGAVVSFEPPLVVDQFKSLANEPPLVPIQYLVAA